MVYCNTFEIVLKKKRNENVMKMSHIKRKVIHIRATVDNAKNWKTSQNVNALLQENLMKSVEVLVRETFILSTI